MIANHRIEISDEQRNVLARLIKPSAPRRLATRTEVCEFVDGCIAGLRGLHKDSPIAFAQDYGAPDEPTPYHKRAITLMALVERARKEDFHALRGKSDSFAIGWCKVKYADELRRVA